MVAAVLAVGVLVALPARAEPAPAPVVYVAGDSIVAGQYLWNPGRDGFVPRLASLLCGQQCGRPGQTTVVSVARGGQRLTPWPGTTHPLVETWDSILDAKPTPTVIVVAVGINDMGNPGDIHRWAAAYRDIAARAVARGIRIVPATMAPTNGRWAGHTTVAWERRTLNGWLRGYFGVSAVADFSLIGLPWDPDTLDFTYDDYPGDGLHPGPYGVMRLADATAEAIRRG